jgi:hypothetical protein
MAFYVAGQIYSLVPRIISEESGFEPLRCTQGDKASVPIFYGLI